MNYSHSNSSTGRLFRGWALGFLATQSALSLWSQTTPATPADATPPPADEMVKLDTFVVSGSGIRFGIEKSIAAKKESITIGETITAEDIGKLPDISIAESIARLPGLAAQRVAGRAQVISVRGLAPDFANTLLNGREQVSTGDNRGVEFDQYPSELIGSVTVHKTPDASLVGQGLSGTLNLQTVMPLAIGKRTIGVNARYEVNSLDNLGSDSEDTGNRFSLTYIDQFANRTFGVAIGFAHLESPITAQEFGTYGWNTNGRGTAPGVTVPAGTFGTDGLKIFTRVGTNKRDGLIGVFQWRPNAKFSSVFDAYYSKFSREETARGIEVHIGGYNGSSTVPMAYTSAKIVNNSLVGGSVSGVYPLARNNYNDRTDKLTAFGWNNQYRTDNWKFTGDISYSKAERDELNLETQAQYRDVANNPVFDTVTYDITSGSFSTARFGVNYADPARIQVGPTIYGAGYGKVPQVEDELVSYKLAASRKLSSFVDAVDFGVNYADRQKDKAQPEAGLNTKTNASGGWAALSNSVLLGNANLSFTGSPNSLSWDVPSALASAYQPFTPSSTAAGYLIQKTWRVDEEITTPYAQFNLNSKLGGDVRLRGNVGVQAQRVDQSSTSNFFDNTAPSGQQVKVNRDCKTYTNVLPSANLVFDFGNDHYLRAGVAKQVARPRLDHLKSAFEFNIDTTTRLPDGSGGNPRLDPWKATAYDLSYEKYFANNKGYFSLAGFYKKLDTYIFEQTDPNYDFSRFTVGSPIPVLSNFGKFKQPINGQGGSLKGLEASLSVPFSMFADVLDGFGFVASYSRNDSAITIDNTNLGNTISLPGLSKTVTNFTVYYEKKGFTARVSQRYRSDFIGEITGFGADRALRYVKGEDVVDAQLGYEIQSGKFKNLGFVLQAYNLTNASYSTYQVNKERIEEYQEYGRTFLVGANYKF